MRAEKDALTIDYKIILKAKMPDNTNEKAHTTGKAREKGRRGKKINSISHISLCVDLLLKQVPAILIFNCVVVVAKRKKQKKATQHKHNHAP